MSAENEQKEVVLSIQKSLQSYLSTKDFEHLFSLGAKLSFVAYALDADSDSKLATIIPSLIRFTEIVHTISQSQNLKDRFDEIITAYLRELYTWLENYFILQTPEVLPSNIIEVLTSSVEGMELLLRDDSEVDDNLDGIFF